MWILRRLPLKKNVFFRMIETGLVFFFAAGICSYVPQFALCLERSYQIYPRKSKNVPIHQNICIVRRVLQGRVKRTSNEQGCRLVPPKHTTYPKRMDGRLKNGGPRLNEWKPSFRILLHPIYLVLRTISDLLTGSIFKSPYIIA